MVRMGPLQGSYDGSIPFTRSKIKIKNSGNVQQSTSFKKAFQARGHRFESCPPCNFFYNNMAVAQLARALKINNKRFLKNREYGTTA